jgi:hypothetical protein
MTNTPCKTQEMSSFASGINDLFAPAQGSVDKRRTHARVQVIPLFICAAASSAFIPATNLPWFGAFSSDNPAPQYSAVSGLLVPPGSPAALVPGTQSWGYLLVAWSALLAALAVVAAVACVLSRNRIARGLSGLLICVGIASLVLVALVVPELIARVPFDQELFLGFDWGAIVGLGLAVLSSFGAWFAWATWTYPSLWGPGQSVN